MTKERFIQLRLRGIVKRKVDVSRRLEAYLRKCLQCNRRAWIRIRLDIVASSFGVSTRTIKRALAKLRGSDTSLVFRTVTIAGGGRGWQVLVSNRQGIEPFMSHHTKDSVRDRIVRTWLRGSRILTLFSRRLSDKINRPHIEGDEVSTILKPKTSWPSGTRRDKLDEEPADAEFADRSRKKHRGLSRYCHWLARDLWTRNFYDNAKVWHSHKHLFSMCYRLKVARISDHIIYRAFARAFLKTHRDATDWGLNNGDPTHKFCLSHTVSEMEKKLLGRCGVSSLLQSSLT